MKLYPIFFLLCLPLFLSAQVTSKLSTGVVAFENQEFEQALGEFDDVLQNPDRLTELEQAKAFYYRGLSNQAIAQEKSGTAEDIHYAFKAFFDYKTVVEKYPNQRIWTTKALGKLDILQPFLKKEGYNLINQAYGPDLPTDRRLELAGAALPYFEALIYIDPGNFSNYDLRGQIRLLQKDSLSALNDFYQAQQLYFSNPPDQPDLLLGYAYYRSALIQKDYKKDTDQALADIHKGIKMVDEAFVQLQSFRSVYNDDQWALTESQYKNAIADLKAFELNIYGKDKDPKQKIAGIDKFEKAIQEDPNNYSIRITYAGMLESIDPEAAIEQYKKAVEIDASKEIALFNLGAIYVNEANRLFNQANEAEDLEEYTKLSKLGKAKYTEALPYLELAYKVNPDNLQTLQAIMQITITTEDMEKYQHYKALRDSKN